MTDYAALSDAELDAAIAVRVMGWHRNPQKNAGALDHNWSPSTCLDDCFSSQEAAPEVIWAEYCRLLAWQSAAESVAYPVGYLLAADARTRCIAMLEAVDAVEQGEST